MCVFAEFPREGLQMGCSLHEPILAIIKLAK